MKTMKNGSKNAVTKVAAAVTIENKAVQGIEGNQVQDQVQVVDLATGNIPPALTETQVKEITAQCVSDLNVQQDNEAQSWIEKGRLVAEYVKKITPTLTKKTNCYNILAAHPDSTLQSQQLRYFHACAELYEKMGGEGRAPNLTMTAFVCVLPKKLTFSDKVRLLEQAETENLSICQLKERVKVATQHDKPVKDCSLPADIQKLTKKFDSQSGRLFATLSALNDNNKPEAPLPQEVKASITGALKRIFEFSKTHGLIDETPENITAPVHMKDAA